MVGAVAATWYAAHTCTTQLLSILWENFLEPIAARHSENQPAHRCVCVCVCTVCTRTRSTVEKLVVSFSYRWAKPNHLFSCRTSFSIIIIIERLLHIDTDSFIYIDTQPMRGNSRVPLATGCFSRISVYRQHSGKSHRRSEENVCTLEI